MEMTDHILFVKETKTCSYVLVIHTPRLCGEPGFKSRPDTEEQARIRCREIVDKKPESQAQLPPAEHPMNVPIRKTVLPISKLKEKPADGSESSQDVFIDDILRKTLQALVNGKKGDKNAMEEDVIIEFVDADLDASGAHLDERLVEALRAAGYDVRAEVITLNDGLAPQSDDKQEQNKKTETATKEAPADHHDEL
jgi:protein OS-9